MDINAFELHEIRRFWKTRTSCPFGMVNECHEAGNGPLFRPQKAGMIRQRKIYTEHNTRWCFQLDATKREDKSQMGASGPARTAPSVIHAPFYPPEAVQLPSRVGTVGYSKKIAPRENPRDASRSAHPGGSPLGPIVSPTIPEETRFRAARRLVHRRLWSRPIPGCARRRNPLRSARACPAGCARRYPAATACHRSERLR